MGRAPDSRSPRSSLGALVLAAVIAGAVAGCGGGGAGDPQEYWTGRPAWHLGGAPDPRTGIVPLVYTGGEGTEATHAVVRRTDEAAIITIHARRPKRAVSNRALFLSCVTVAVPGGSLTPRLVDGSQARGRPSGQTMRHRWAARRLYRQIRAAGGRCPSLPVLP